MTDYDVATRVLVDGERVRLAAGDYEAAMVFDGLALQPRTTRGDQS